LRDRGYKTAAYLIKLRLSIEVGFEDPTVSCLQVFEAI
jgi:hypothetical protein